MNPEQQEDIEVFESLTPTIPQLKYRKRHLKKLRLFIEQDGICCICEKPMRLKYGAGNGRYATFEHVQVRSNGGTFHDNNVPLSCGSCNRRRGTHDFHKFKQMVKAGLKITKSGGSMNKRQKLRQDAFNGDADALETLLSKKLNLALYIMALEEGWATNSSISIEVLKSRLDNPIKL